MKRIISIYILIFFSITAHGYNVNPAEGPAVKRQKVMEYVSLGNDFADIKMELFDNGKFKLYINQKNGKELNLKGTWEKKDNYYFLKFKKTQLPVNELFNMNDPTRLQVLDELDVRFSKHLSSLWIWGIQCKKSDEVMDSVLASQNEDEGEKIVN